MVPKRYTPGVAAAARKKHGPRADRVAEYLCTADPLADNLVAEFRNRKAWGRARPMDAFDLALAKGIGAVRNAPAALRNLVAEVETVPPWLDWDLIELGCRTHRRCGPLASLVVGCSALPLAYRSGAGAKSLVYTGELLDEHRAIERLSQTNRFFLAAATPGGLRPRARAWQMTVRVRVLFHAQTRWWLRQLRDPAWKPDEYGAPINQVDMAATRLLFCVNLLRHLRRLGFRFSPAESDAVMHVWRYAGYLLGIAPELLCATEVEGRRLLRLLLDVAGGPDDDSRALTEKLMKTAMPKLMEVVVGALFPDGDVPGERPPRGWLARLYHGLAWRPGLRLRRAMNTEQLSRVCYGLAAAILGRKTAAELKFEDTAWRYAAPLMLLSLVAPLEVCRLIIPGGTDLAARVGDRLLQKLRRFEDVARRSPSGPLI
jgi:hypothetical protein